MTITILSFLFIVAFAMNILLVRGDDFRWLENLTEV